MLPGGFFPLAISSLKKVTRQLEGARTFRMVVRSFYGNRECLVGGSIMVQQSKLAKLVAAWLKNGLAISLGSVFQVFPYIKTKAELCLALPSERSCLLYDLPTAITSVVTVLVVGFIKAPFKSLPIVLVAIAVVTRIVRCALPIRLRILPTAI